MLSHRKYLVFANEADIRAETAVDPVLRAHFLHMAEQWRDLADFTLRTEALRPGGPILD